jgi:hypothetical protein
VLHGSRAPLLVSGAEELLPVPDGPAWDRDR